LLRSLMPRSRALPSFASLLRRSSCATKAERRGGTGFHQSLPPKHLMRRRRASTKAQSLARRKDV